jgi:hypothetical protein
MGATVLPMYLVPALTLVLALGLAAETHRDRRPAVMRSRCQQADGEQCVGQG